MTLPAVAAARYTVTRYVNILVRIRDRVRVRVRIRARPRVRGRPRCVRACYF